MLRSRDAGFVDMYVDESVDVYADASHLGHFRIFAKMGESQEDDVCGRT